MTCLSPDDLSNASSNFSTPARRHLFSPFSDASTSSNVNYSSIRHGSPSASVRSWLETATSDSINHRRRQSSCSPHRHSLLSRERKRILEHDSARSSRQPSPSQVSVTTEERINWALNHSSDKAFPEELKSSSGISSTPSSGDERNNYTLYHQQASSKFENGTFHLANDPMSKPDEILQSDVSDHGQSILKNFEKQLTIELIHTMTELKDLAEIARVIDEVDDEEWLLIFIGELEIQLNDLLRSDSKNIHPQNELKQKQTLLDVAQDLVRYLKERCRWTLRKKKSISAGGREQEHIIEGESTLQRMKSLAASTAQEIDVMNEWQNKLTRLALTLDRYLTLLTSDERLHQQQEFIDEKPQAKTIARSKQTTEYTTNSKPSRSTTKCQLTPRYDPSCKESRNQLLALEKWSTFDERSLPKQKNFVNPQSNDKQSPRQVFSSSVCLPADFDDVVVPVVFASELTLNVTETDFNFTPHSNGDDQAYISHYKKKQSNDRATKCPCPGKPNSNNNIPTTFHTSFSLQQCNEAKTETNLSVHPSNHDNAASEIGGFFSRLNDVQSQADIAFKSDSDGETQNLDDVRTAYNDVTNRPSDVSEEQLESLNFQRLHRKKQNERNQPKTFVTTTEKEVVPQAVNTKFSTSSFVPVAAPRKLKNQKCVLTKNIDFDNTNEGNEQFYSSLVNTTSMKSNTNKEIRKFYELDHSSSSQPSFSCVSTRRGDNDSSSNTADHQGKIISPITSSAVQCDIVSEKDLEESNSEIRKLRDSTELLKRGITEAREERDDKDRKIAVLETRVQRLKKNMEATTMERGSAAVELQRLQRLLEKEKKYREWEIAELLEKCNKLEEEKVKKQRRINDLLEIIDKLKKETLLIDAKCQKLEKDKNQVEQKLYETTVALMKEKHQNRSLYVENLKLEQEIAKRRADGKLKDKENKEMEKRSEVSDVLNDVINAVVEEQHGRTKEEMRQLRHSLDEAENFNDNLRKENEELQLLLSNERDQSLAATDCFRQQIEFLSNEVSIQTEAARLQKEQYDNEIHRLFSSRSHDYNASNNDVEDREAEMQTLRSQLASQATHTKTLFAENERLREERDELRTQLSSNRNPENETISQEFGCQVEDTYYTKIKAHDFYLQEAVKNARRLNDRGSQLHKDTIQAARKARKLDFEVTIATQR